jgi:hypothetical protein
VTNTRASSDGYVSAIQATIKLLEYNTTSAVKQQGSAMASNSPVEETPVTQFEPLPAQITSDINNGIVKTDEIQARKKSNKVNYEKISSLANDAISAFDSANNKVSNTEKIVNRAIDLQNSLTSAKNAAQAVKNAADIRNFADLESANDNLTVSVYHLKGVAAPVAAFVGSREGGK